MGEGIYIDKISKRATSVEEPLLSFALDHLDDKQRTLFLLTNKQ